MIKILSFGGGVQSTCLHLMQLPQFNELEPVDHSVFADPGWEPATNAFIKRLHKAGYGEISTVKNGSIREDLIAAGRGERKFTSIPGFTSDNGKPQMIQRQCTRDYKITPVRRFCSDALAARGLQKTPGIIELWLGISTDEQLRVKPSRVQYVRHRYPLIELRMSRDDCIAWMESKGVEVPGKSACLGCPFRNTQNWASLTPCERKDVTEVDEAIRNIGRLKNQFYLNRKLIPMKQFFEELPTLEQLNADLEHRRNHFNNECEGHCGV